MALIGNRSEVKSLSDSVEISSNVGFEVNQDATLVYRLREDTADRTWAFKQNVFYPYDIKLAKATGSTGGTTVLVIHARRS